MELQESPVNGDITFYFPPHELVLKGSGEITYDGRIIDVDTELVAKMRELLNMPKVTKP